MAQLRDESPLHDGERDAIARQTFTEFGTRRLTALCHAVAAPGATDGFVRLFQRMLHPWGDRRIGTRPLYPSNIADDEAPFEFAVALSAGTPEVQFYVEAQADSPSLRSNMTAGRALLEAVASELGAPLDRLRRVEPLFFPEDPQGPFTVWIGASWAAGREVKLKVYLNPRVRGEQAAPGLVGEAMARLGFATAWSAVKSALSFDGERHDEIGIVSLELSGAADARAKVYIRHHRATAARIDAIARLTRTYDANDVPAFYAAVARHVGPFQRKPALTELAFVDANDAHPASITLEFPLGSYVGTDQDAAQRIRECLTRFGLGTEAYDRAIRAFATRPLGERSGMHAHVTLSRVRKQPRIGVYLASEAFVHAPHLVSGGHPL